jgi:hypothetical protein
MRTGRVPVHVLHPQNQSVQEEVVRTETHDAVDPDRSVVEHETSFPEPNANTKVSFALSEQVFPFAAVEDIRT